MPDRIRDPCVARGRNVRESERVECQSYKAESIGKRARYYQSMLDIGSLARGASYTELKESYVIFICLSDPFEAGLPAYTFERRCRESEDVALGDETHHIIFNAAAYEKEADPEIKAFLAFVKNNKAESDLTREIATVVQTKKFEQSFINEYLAWTLHDQDVEMRIKKEQALATARRMLASGKYGMDEISDISGLTMQDIQALSANP